jgi:anti-sigma regulatory factor (Ser/Thr protein kinase)
MDYCELQFASDPTRVRQIVRCLLEFAGSLKVEDRDDLKLVLNELLFNAVIHGNNEDPGKSVQIRLESKKDFISVSIQDEGKGFDHEKVLNRPKDESSLMSEHGRGMMLVSALTDSISFNKAGNRLRFTKKVAHG